MKKVKLFVYGTLMKDFRNYEKYLKGRVSEFKKAHTDGQLYHLKHKNCPAMIQGGDRVYGEVMVYNDNDQLGLLRELDLMEEYFEGSSKPMYRRQEINVWYDDGSKDKAFAYIFIRSDSLNGSNSEYVKQGDWGRYIKEKSI